VSPVKRSTAGTVGALISSVLSTNRDAHSPICRGRLGQVAINYQCYAAQTPDQNHPLVAKGRKTAVKDQAGRGWGACLPGLPQANCG
jgi:hypothetical protein